MGALTELQTIPGVGASVSQHLFDLGYRKVADLKGENPEQIYQNLVTLKGEHVDRCVLYVLRGAVYYASNKVHDPELLKWWNWNNKEEPCLAKSNTTRSARTANTHSTTHI